MKLVGEDGGRTRSSSGTCAVTSFQLRSGGHKLSKNPAPRPGAGESTFSWQWPRAAQLQGTAGRRFVKITKVQGG